MRIGFDCSPLHRPHPPGVVRVVRECLRILGERGRLDIENLVPPEGMELSKWRQKVLPKEVEEKGLGGVHSFVSAFPWRGPGKRVQTIHELPWKNGVRENADWKHRLWASIGSRRADATITPSAFVARQIGKPLERDGGKLHIVPWGVDGMFTEEPPPGTVDEPLLERYRLPDADLALCLGAVRPKKNLAAVLQGVARLHERRVRELHVVVTGADSPQLRKDLALAQRLGIARWISTPGEIEEADLPGLLRLAAVVPVLSRSEGFGLPVLEALACGTPVVVPRGTAQAEIAGPDGIVVDPTDPDSVADGLDKAVLEPEKLRYSLPERAREFPWVRTAVGIEQVWAGLA